MTPGFQEGDVHNSHKSSNIAGFLLDKFYACPRKVGGEVPEILSDPKYQRIRKRPLAKEKAAFNRDQ